MNWEGPNYPDSALRIEIVSPAASERAGYFSKTLGGFPTPGRQAPSDKIRVMPKRLLFRWMMPAIAGLLVGFLALAWASTSEATLPVLFVAVISPGLKVAELVMPAAHESLASTFGWFLRISIGVNAAFYFAIFAFLAYLADRRRTASS